MTRYTELLKNRKFLQWQLMPDEELNSYWENQLKEHPALKKEVDHAVRYLKEKGLNSDQLSDTERTQLLLRIKKSTAAASKAKRYRMIRNASVSIAAIGLLLLVIRLFSPSQHTTATSNEELIVGEMLNNEDIRLITKNKAITFQNDVTLTLNEEGKADITQPNQEKKQIEVAQDVLNSLIVPYGKRSTLTLADGSRIWLNSGSVLEFPATFNGKKREIHLKSGEMYIEVSHDIEKPFYVHTHNFGVKVYGTKFNISNYSTAPQSVVLVEGSIGLELSGKEEIRLKPNQQAIYQENSFTTADVDINNFISWREGYLSFNKTPMTQVLNQIGRYYNVSFNFENDVNLQKRTCTGKIYLSDSLDNVMTTIGILSSTTYKRTEDKIIITNNHS